MATIANIALTDGESTPVVHTFVPQQRPGADGVARYINRVSGAAPVGFEHLTIGDSQIKSPNSDYQRVTARLKLPTTAINADTGVEELQYLEEVNIEFKLSKVGTAQGRKNLVTMAQDLIGEAVLAVDAVENREMTY